MAEEAKRHPAGGAAPLPDERRRQLVSQIAEIDAALPGSLVIRSMRCGKAVCRCKADPPQLHGPYIQWTRKIDGRTRTRMLSPEQLARYQPWFDNARRLRELLAELEGLTLRAAEEAEGWSDER
jgi:hypothetical protein